LIELLAGGTELSQAITTAGVTARTVQRWNMDPAFEARLNARRREVWEGVQDQGRSLLAKALDIYASKLEEGTLAAARDVLKVFGPTVAPILGRIGSPDPRDIAMQAGIKEQIRVVAGSTLNGDQQAQGKAAIDEE
jgi:hypothetical protein